MQISQEINKSLIHQKRVKYRYFQMLLFSPLVDALLAIPAPPGWESHVTGKLQSSGLVASEALLGNLHSIIYITAFYQVVFVLCARLLLPGLCDWRIGLKLEEERDLKVEHKYSRAQRAKSLAEQAAMHLVSFLQSLIVLDLSIAFLASPERSGLGVYPDAYSRIFGETRETQVVCIFAIGYFIWDALISMAYSTLPFVMHGVVSTSVYLIGIKPYLQWYAPVFLIFELSNPFLNFRWFGTKFLPAQTQCKWLRQLLQVNNLVFLLTFFAGRIAWGWYQIGALCCDFYLVSEDARFLPFDTFVIVAGNLVLDVLNAIWFKTMLGVAIKTICGKGKGKSAPREKHVKGC